MSDALVYSLLQEVATKMNRMDRRVETLEAGEPLLPTSVFLAYTSASVGSVTGAGAYYSVIFDTEVIDSSSAYSASTGFFTAPSDGTYLFGATVLAASVGTAHTMGTVMLATSNRLYRGTYCDPNAMKTSSSFASFSITTLADMETGDAARIRLYVYNGTPTVGVYGGDSGFSYFWGIRLF